MALLEHCFHCEWEETWEGGPASEDPGIKHAKETGHTVHTKVVNDG